MLYNIFFYLMLAGFGGLAITSLGWKGKVIGICLLIVNFLIYKK